MNANRSDQGELLHELQQQRDALAAEGLCLVQRWAATFPRGALAFRLVRLSGESNTLLRWRSNGRAAIPRGARFELIDAQDLVASLPQRARELLLDIEQQRIAINHGYAVAAYRARRLEMLLAQRDALARLRQLHGHRAPQATPSPWR